MSRHTEKLAKQIEPYGYTIDSDGIITTPTGKVTGVRLEVKRGRVRAVAVAGETLLWSGPNAGHFLETFWYTKKVRP